MKKEKRDALGYAPQLDVRLLDNQLPVPAPHHRARGSSNGDASSTWFMSVAMHHPHGSCQWRCIVHTVHVTVMHHAWAARASACCWVIRRAQVMRCAYPATLQWFAVGSEHAYITRVR